VTDIYDAMLSTLADFLENNDTLIPRKHLLAAWKIFMELEKEEFTPALLHGDLHHYNILKHEDKWMIIDPNGVTGNPLYETAGYMYNPSPQFLKYHNLPKVIQSRLAIFNEILGYPVDQIAAMAYCQSVLSACWCLQDKEDCWENALFWADLFY
jgi:streptomycin 6-kinase